MVNHLKKFILITEHVTEGSFINNDSNIEALKSKYNIPYIDINSSIKAVRFDKINHYYKNGYFLFYDLNGKLSIAIHNIYILKGERYEKIFNYYKAQFDTGKFRGVAK